MTLLQQRSYVTQRTRSSLAATLLHTSPLTPHPYHNFPKQTQVARQTWSTQRAELSDALAAWVLRTASARMDSPVTPHSTLHLSDAGHTPRTTTTSPPHHRRRRQPPITASTQAYRTIPSSSRLDSLAFARHPRELCVSTRDMLRLLYSDHYAAIFGISHRAPCRCTIYHGLVMRSDLPTTFRVATRRPIRVGALAPLQATRSFVAPRFRPWASPRARRRRS